MRRRIDGLNLTCRSTSTGNCFIWIPERPSGATSFRTRASREITRNSRRPWPAAYPWCRCWCGVHGCRLKLTCQRACGRWPIETAWRSARTRTSIATLTGSNNNCALCLHALSVMWVRRANRRRQIGGRRAGDHLIDGLVGGCEITAAP